MSAPADAASAPAAPAPASPARPSLGALALVGVFASALGLVTAIARSKVTALVLGPDGLGRSAAIQQIAAMLVVPLSLVTGPALLTALARAKGDRARQQPVLDTAATLLLAGGALVALVSAAAAPFVLPQAGPVVSLLAFCAGLAAAALPLAGLPAQVLLAEGKLARHAQLSVLLNLSLAVAVIAATWRFGIEGQFAAAALAPVVLMLALLPVWRRLLPGVRLLPRPQVDRAFLRESFTVGTTALIAGFCLQGGLTVVRLLLERAGGDHANGQFQAAYAIGSTYFGVVLTGLGNAVFPRYAAAESPQELQREIDDALRFVYRAAPPCILAAIALREPVMHALYSTKFDEAAGMVGYQMAGDLAKAVSWALAGPLLFRGKVRAFLVTEVAYNVLFIGASALLVPLVGAAGASYAYALSYGLYVVVAALVAARALEVSVQWRPVVGSLLFGAVASASVWASDRWPLLRVALFVVAGAWFLRSGLLGPVVAKVRRKLGFAAPAAE